jgi:hypothetical protein
MKHLKYLLNVVVLSDSVFDPTTCLMNLRDIYELLLDSEEHSNQEADVDAESLL